jgi:hypothetical protein
LALLAPTRPHRAASFHSPPISSTLHALTRGAAMNDLAISTDTLLEADHRHLIHPLHFPAE